MKSFKSLLICQPSKNIRASQFEIQFQKSKLCLPAYLFQGRHGRFLAGKDTMAVRVVEFTKLERFLNKNQHTQIKLLNFEFWINGEPSKIGHHFSNKFF